MFRDKLKELIAWKSKKYRKPLILEGARQVGKTWLLKEFGRLYYKTTVYVNFEDASALKNIFKGDFDTKRILEVLQIYSGSKISAKDTLIILDEIQAAEGGITSLKYFAENAPEYNIVAAGSLLGMTINSGVSFPVGKVDFIKLYPLSFGEFLRAMDEDQLYERLESLDWAMLGLFKDKLENYLRMYFFIGGMPEVVDAYARTKDLSTVRDIQKRLLLSYEGDFSKHAPLTTVPRIRMVWQSIPMQLAKENKKFVYGALKDGARAKDFELAIQWLLDAGLLLKCNRVGKGAMPLIAYQDISAFKLYLFDTGLLSAMAGLDAASVINGNQVFTEFRGALTEQYVLQEITSSNSSPAYYWTSGATAEVDFVVQDGEKIIPIEVKASTNLKAKSLKEYIGKYSPEIAIRTSLSDYKVTNNLYDIPLYTFGSYFQQFRHA